MAGEIRCPQCASADFMFSKKRQVYVCEDCGHEWQRNTAESPSAPGPTRIFLSYARGDDADFVERLYHDLTARGFDVWYDHVSMPSRQLTFYQEIRNAVTACDRLVLVVGPKAAASDYVTQEWQFAYYVSNRCVNPIVRLDGRDPAGNPLDGYRLIPAEIGKLHAEDFRDDTRYAFHLDNLVRQLSAPLPPVGKLVAVPELPPGFRAMPERLEVLRDLLLADLNRPVVVSGAAARLGMHGMGGIGKSVLASAMARHPDVRRAFPDGIFWLALGQQPDVVNMQRWLARQLEDPALFDTENDGKEKLRALLTGRDVLLILDNVWDRAHAEAFNVISGHSRILITTRDAGLVTALASRENHFPVHLPSHAEARALLASAAEVEPEDLPPQAENIVSQCDRLPLALALCGGMIHARVPWQDVVDALEQHDLAFLSTDHPAEEQHSNVWKAMDVSLRVLPEDQQQRYAELAVFGLDTGAVGAAVGTLWAHTGGLSARESRKLLADFARRSLVQITNLDRADDGPAQRIVLHDLLHNFATGMAGKRLGSEAALHGLLLDAYHATCTDGWATGPNDGYFLERLSWHLARAGRVDELAALLEDLAFLEAKVAAGLAFDLPRDFSEALEAVPYAHRHREVIGLLDEAIRRDIHFIARHAEDYPQALFQCLWNSCWWYDCPDAAAHYIEPEGGWQTPPPWKYRDCPKRSEAETGLSPDISRFDSGLTPPERGASEGGSVPGISPSVPRLYTLLEVWREQRQKKQPAFPWLRSLRPPPMHLGTAQKAVFQGHASPVISVSFSPDGHRIVSGSWDDTVRIWDAHTGQELTCMKGHTANVHSVSFSPDGHRIVSGSSDNTIRIWDAQSGQELQCLKGHTSAVHSVSFSPDGHRIVSGSGDNTIRIWDAHSGQELRCMEGHTGLVPSVSFSPDGHRIVSGSGGLYEDNTVRIWDAQSGQELRCLKGHTNSVWSVSFSPDGHRIVSGSLDDTIRIWDAQSGQELRCLKGHTDYVTSVSFSPDGHRIVSGSSDHTVRIWDAQSGQELRCLKGHTDYVTSVSFSPDGHRIVSGSSDHTVRIWDAQSGQELRCLKGHTDFVRSVSFSPDGHRIVSGSEDHTVRIWDAQSGQELRCLEGHTSWVHSVSFSPDGHRIVSGSGDYDGKDYTVRIWDAQSGQELRCLKGHTAPITSVSFSPDGHRIVSGSIDKTVRIWEAQSGQELQCLKGHRFIVDSVSFSPDGHRIVSGSGDDTVRIWDAQSGECLQVIEGRGDTAAIASGPEVHSFHAIRRDGETVVTSLAPDTVPLAWFPDVLIHVTTHPAEPVWAGWFREDFWLIRLERA